MHNSKFNAGLFSWIWLMLWTTTVNFLTLFIAYPWTMCAVYGWRIDNLVVNGYQMKFDGQGHQLFGMWLQWWVLTVITLGIYALWIPVKLVQWQATHTFLPQLEQYHADVAAYQQATQQPAITPVQ